MAALGLTAIREIFPAREPESDLAAALRLELLTDIVNLVGPERYLEAVKKAITMSSSRYDCTVRKIRFCAGLKESKPVDPAVSAWKLVTDIVRKHVRLGPEGQYRLEPYYAIDGKSDDPTAEPEKSLPTFSIYPVPEIPEAVQEAVRALGGWRALANTLPEFWHAKMKDFLTLYEE